MGIKKRSINSQGDYTDYAHLKNDFNSSSINNPTHQVNLPTNFNLKPITLEDCDMAVYEEFNKRFKISEKLMPLIILDAELVSLNLQNYEQFDSDKTYLNLPFFTYYRKKSTPKYRTNPAYKKVMYVVPKQKPNGLVYEEWISEGPLAYTLVYDLYFISNRRDTSNEMETHMRHYFRNKRNIIIVNNERFSIGPEDFENLSTVEVVNRESLEQKTVYLTTYTLKLDCFTRDLSNMQKRERPNKIQLDLLVNGQFDGDAIVVDRYDLDATPGYPKHPIPKGLQTIKNNNTTNTNNPSSQGFDEGFDEGFG